MKRNFFLKPLAAASMLVAAGGAFAADRVELHNQDFTALKGQYQNAFAQHGVAKMDHTRHAQLIQLDAESNK